MGAVWLMLPEAVRNSSRLPFPPLMAPSISMPAVACRLKPVSLVHETGLTTRIMPAPVPAKLSVLTVTMLVASAASSVATLRSESLTGPEATKIPSEMSLPEVSLPVMPAPVALAWSLAM